MAASVRILLTPFPAPLDITIDYFVSLSWTPNKKNTRRQWCNATTHASTACYGVPRRVQVNAWVTYLEYKAFVETEMGCDTKV